jgi:aminopeptidase N
VTPKPTIYNPSEKKVNDLIHTRLDLSLDWEKQYLEGVATLEFKPYFYPSDRLILDAKGFEIKSVELKSDSGLIDLDHKYDGWYLDISLDKKYSRFENYTVRIAYTAKPNEIQDPGTGGYLEEKGLYFINADSTESDKPTQVWTQGQTEANSCWFPTIDSPNERMTQEVFITVDEHLKTLSNGEHLYSNYNADGSRTDYWRMQLSHPPYLSMLTVGDFVVAQDTWTNEKGDEIPVQYFMEPEYANYAYNIFGNTPEMMSFYSEILGYEYPWEKFAQIIVRDYVSGAMENTSAVIHGEFMNSTDRQLLDYDYEDVIAHELFHHWFGDLVTCESWAHLPLNESFATYGEYLWIEHKYGIDAADYHAWESLLGYFSEAQYKKVDLIRFDYEDRNDMFDAHSYNKGGYILHMLRDLIGDEAFFSSLSDYLNENAFHDAEVHTLRLSVEKVTGMDLNWFFNQWFLSSGHPELSVSYEWNDSLKTQTVSIEQTQNSEDYPTYQLPLVISVYENGVRTDHEEIITTRSEKFTYTCTAKPELVNVDRDKRLLAEFDDHRPEEYWSAAYGYATNFEDRYNAVNHAIDNPVVSMDSTVIKALEDPFWYIRSKALEGIKDLALRHPDVEGQVASMFGDEKSLVRADVIYTLADAFDGEKYLPQFEEALNDRSFAVISAAIYAITKTDRKKGLELSKSMESDPQLTEAIAEVYAEFGGTEQLGFYQNAYPGLSGGELYGFAQQFGEYLKKQDVPTTLAGVETLREMTMNAEPWWTKLAIYGALGGVREKYATEVEDVEKKIAVLNEETPPETRQALDRDLEKVKGQHQEVIKIIDDLKSAETHERLKLMIGN